MGFRHVVWISIGCAVLLACGTADAQQLQRAIQAGDIAAVRGLVERDNETVNFPGPGGATPLHIAVNWERVEIIKELLAHGADPLLPDNEGRTPLYWATKGKNVEIRRLLEDAVAQRRARGGAASATTRATTQPAGFWTWLLGGNQSAPAAAGGTFTCEKHNYRLRELQRPWAKLNPASVSQDATYAAIRADLRMQVAIISEATTGAMTLEAYVDLVSAGFESRVPSARRVGSRPRLVNGMAGTEVAHDLMIGAVPHQRVCWHFVHDGFAYQIAFVGPASARTQLEKAAGEVLAGFSMIDPGRGAPLATAMPKFVGDLGFTVEIAENGWEAIGQAELPRYSSTFIARRGSGLQLHVLVASLAGRAAEASEIAAAMSRIAGLSMPSGGGIRTLPAARGIEAMTFDAKPTVAGPIVRVEPRLFRRGELVYLVWAAAGEAHRGVDLNRILDCVRLTPDGPTALAPEKLPPHQRQTAGIFLNEMGIQRLQASDPSSATAFFEAARRFVPDDWVVFSNVVDAMAKAGKHRAALIVVTGELDRFKRSSNILLTKATLEYTVGDSAQARQTYAELFKSGYQNDSQFRLYLALLEKAQMNDEAIAAAEEYWRRTGSVGATVILSELYAKRGSHDRAIKLLQECQGKLPFNSTLAMAMGDIYLLTGEYPRAQELVQKLLDAGNNSSQTYILKGRAEFGLKLYRTAKDSFESALRASPGDAVAGEWLTTVSRFLGEGDNSSIKQAIPAVDLPAEFLKRPDAARIAALSSGHSACNLVRATAISFEPGKSMTTTQYRTVKVLDLHGVEQFKLLTERFDPLYEHVYVNRLIVRDEQDNIIAQGRPADYYVQDDSESATSWRVLHIPVPGIRPGCLLEMVITRCEEPAPKAFRFDDEVFLSVHPAERMIVALKAPRDTVQWRGIRLPQPVEVDGFLAWSVTPTIWRNEPLQAPFEDYVSCLMIADRGPTWRSVAAEYRRSIEDLLKPDPAAAELAKRLTASDLDANARLASLLRKLQKDFTYKAVAFGRRARIPQHVAEIIRNSYGDCKDHSLLLMQMLNALGVEAHLALVRSAGPFAPELPSLDQFDHMIVYMPAQDAFFDATDKCGNLTVGVPWGLAGRTCLVLDPKEPRLKVIAAAPADSGRIEVQRAARFDKGLDLLICETSRLTGIYGSEFRSLLQSAEPREWPRTMERLLNETGLTGRVRKFNVEGLDAPDKPLAIEVEYVAQRAFRRLNGQFVGAVPCPIERYFYIPPMVDRRETPFKLQYPTSLQSTVTFELPADCQFVGSPPAASASEPHTRGQVSHVVTGRTLRSTLAVANDSVSFPPDAYEAFARCRQDILDGLEAGIAIAPARK